MADTPAAHIWQGFVPEDAYASTVVYPQRILANPAIAKLIDPGMVAEVVKHAGVAPDEIEQVVAVFGPLGEGERGGPPTPKTAVIARFTKSHDGAELAAKWLESAKPEQIEIAGRKCFQRAADAQHPRSPTDVAICFVDDRTVVAAMPSWMPEVLGAKDATSPLISAMAASDPAADATIIFVNNDTIKAMAKSVPPQMLPGPLQSFAALPDLLRAVKLAIYTTPKLGLKFMFIGNDDASAEKIAGMIRTLQQMGQGFLPMLQRPADPNMPAEARQSQQYAAEMAGKLVKGLVPQQSGKKVTVEINDLGSLDELVMNVVMPAMMAAHGAAHSAATSNNLKQIGLAMILYESERMVFPPRAIFSKDGKPLLSWRVTLLPYLDQKALYDQFHLDEAWDSPNNKPLVAKMPTIFGSPGSPQKDGQTRYLVAVGKGAMFDGEKGVTSESATDGLSNTILALEVGPDKAVTWTKPDDVDFNPQQPLAGLGKMGGATITAVFGDGHIGRLPKDIDADSFRWLILRNDGHDVNLLDLGKRASEH